MITFPERTKELVLDLFKDYPNAFLTGSREFGWSNNESDYDVCISIGDKDRAFEMIKKLSTEYITSEYYDSAKGAGIIITDPADGLSRIVTINPIPLHPMDMLCWWLATREISHLAKIDSSRIGDRNFKHGAFELLRGFYKTMIEYKDVQAILDREQANHKSRT